MTINNRGLRGQPNLPYVDTRSYAGTDAFVELTFLNFAGVTVTPAGITYQLDDISNSVSMIPATAVAPTGSTQTLQLPGAKMQMTYPAIAQGSQICQLLVTATLPDGSVGKTVVIIELVAIQTP